ncbi:MAG TPA: lipoprotein [Gammaproteobacteria bacterium]|nr:lipoprotein [Gammaproteobacteria bacterium]
MRRLLLLTVLLLAACGQKGPLFLPPPEAEPAPVENPSNDKSTLNENAHAKTPPDSR